MSSTKFPVCFMTYGLLIYGGSYLLNLILTNETTKTRPFCVRKLYIPISLISLNGQIHLVQVRKLISVQVQIFSINIHNTIICVAGWWENYLLNLIELTSPWRIKAIILFNSNFSMNRFSADCFVNTHWNFQGRVSREISEILRKKSCFQ